MNRKPRVPESACFAMAGVVANLPATHLTVMLLLSSGVADIGASGTMRSPPSQNIALLPIAPKFGTKEVNIFSQSQAEFYAI